MIKKKPALQLPKCSQACEYTLNEKLRQGEIQKEHTSNVDHTVPDWSVTPT